MEIVKVSRIMHTLFFSDLASASASFITVFHLSVRTAKTRSVNLNIHELPCDLTDIANMEIMEDGNLVDRVRILLQRDMQYYQEMQTVLRESLCVRVSGGKLDFPRHASFAAIKIVAWWEVDFLAAFGRPSGLSHAGEGRAADEDSEEGVAKKIQPSEFILLVVDTAQQLLEHLHTLIQECLDHADLTVLTATLGAAALVRNCLWCYNQHAKGAVPAQSSERINKAYKSYHEMAEAVAERLLDLHCRLIGLYVLNEADSLGWHDDKPFFEKERCTYVIQMWWLYMQGTKADLWNTVPPKMAQRVFSGMLNDSLSIIASRFIHGRPSLARSEQFWADAFNVLRCTGHLALCACVDSDEMTGARSNALRVAIRDVHAKCNELLICLLLRGTPLKELYQACRNGLENLAILRARRGPAPWLRVCAPDLLGSGEPATTLSHRSAAILELNVLRQQPQPDWTQLMKVLSMDDRVVARTLLRSLVRQCIGATFRDERNAGSSRDARKAEGMDCGGFLCSRAVCDPSLVISPALALYSLAHVVAVSVAEPDRVLVPAIKEDPDWSSYLDRQQVWNQSKPAWLNALLKPLAPMMGSIVDTLLDAVKTGASIYQTMSLAVGCFGELYPTVPVAILRATFALDDNVPAHCHPIGSSVLLQLLCASLYTAFLDAAEQHESDPPDTSTSIDANREPISFDPRDKSAAAIALAEAICSIDEDNKHTAQIDSFLALVRDSVTTPRPSANGRPGEPYSIIEARTDELLFTDTGRRSLKVVHEYTVRASAWLLDALRDGERSAEGRSIDLPAAPPTAKPLTHIMFHVGDTAFDQFLIDYESTNWGTALTVPLSVTVERARGQILARPEFKNVGDLSIEEREVVNSMKRLCSAVRAARFK